MKLILLPVMAVILLSGCARQIESGLSERDAQEIVVTLRENGIDAFAEADAVGKKDGSIWQVKIRGGGEQAVTAWKVLQENGLPRENVGGGMPSSRSRE